MSEGEIAILRREIRDLSDKSDRQHAENRASQAQDRETFQKAIMTQQQTFATAMNEQRNAFQEALNKQFLEQVEIDKKVDRQAALQENCEGRLSALETAMEVMKKFRWQALTIVAFMMWAVEVWRHGR